MDILLISPERLANERFRTEVLAGIAGRIALLVIDEAHCISDWGHDFRPHYRLLERIVRTLPANLRLLATTATANNRVMDDLRTVLGPNLRRFARRPEPAIARAPDDTPAKSGGAFGLAGGAGGHAAGPRDHLHPYGARCGAGGRLASGRAGFNVESYHGRDGRRVECPNWKQALLENQVKALVATTALGMGFDKPDLAFVIHYQTPGSVVAYYQQVGRAGRALDAAYGVLLSGEEETDITDYFIESAFPTRAEVGSVLEALEAAPAGLSVPELMGKGQSQQGPDREDHLRCFSLESPAPIAKQGTKWQLTAANLSEAFWQRAERLTDSAPRSSSSRCRTT